MSLPKNLQEAISVEVKAANLSEIRKGHESLSKRYRDKEHSHDTSYSMRSLSERIAYIAARMPATYAAVECVLKELEKDKEAITTLLDLGSGPGTVLWAAQRAFPLLSSAVLVEQDQQLVSLGKRLCSTLSEISALSINWRVGDLKAFDEGHGYDLVTLSYSVGELPSKSIEELIKNCWKQTKRFIAIIEPGTPEGFERIRTIRSHLIELGAHIVAPCPHAGSCPMNESNWCHFSVRVERTSEHRQLKRGALGYEDEKFSYIIASKESYFSFPKGRVLRHPLKRSGHLIFDVCASQGLSRRIISKKDSEGYKRAVKLQWGDPFF